MFPALKELYSLSCLPNKRASVLVYVKAITIKNTTLCKHHKVSRLGVCVIRTTIRELHGSSAANFPSTNLPSTLSSVDRATDC